jgi:hypothetical protein
MEYILQSLHELDGVNGAIVADERGQVVGWHARVIYDAELLQQVSQFVVHAVDSVKLLEENWDSLTSQFTEGKLLIRNLTDLAKPEPRPLTLTVIADNRLNLSFAAVALRVAVTKLKAFLGKENRPSMPLAGSSPVGIGGRAAPAPGHPLNASSSLGSSSSFGNSSGGASLGRSSSADFATTGVSWLAQSSGTTSSISGLMVADQSSAAFLTVCTKTLTRKLGPMAKVLVKEAAIRVSPDQPFSLLRAKELIAELAKHIRKPTDAQDFCQTVEKSL